MSNNKMKPLEFWNEVEKAGGLAQAFQKGITHSNLDRESDKTFYLTISHCYTDYMVFDNFAGCAEDYIKELRVKIDN